MKMFFINRYPLTEYQRFKKVKQPIESQKLPELTVSIIPANIHKFEHHFLLNHVGSVCLYTHIDMFFLPSHTPTEYYK